MLPDIQRWTPNRKAYILDLISRHAVDEEAIKQRYNLSSEELAEWRLSRDLVGRSDIKTITVRRQLLALGYKPKPRG